MAKKAAVQEPDVIDVGQVSEEQQEIASTGLSVTSFLAGVGGFLTTAKTLEAKADALEVRSKAFTAPAPGDAAADAALQKFVQEANAAKKAIEGHWGITSVFHGFHKKLVALRDRGADKAGDAADRAQKLHNAYVAAEKRRAAEETARLQREAEERAAAERRRELEAQEARALELEAAAADLSDRERTFVDVFIGGATASLAAKAAGYKDPVGQAARLMGSAKVLAAVKAAQEAIALRRQAAATAARPLVVDDVEEVAPAVQKEGTDRTTWKGEIVDLAAFLEFALGVKSDALLASGVPADLLTIDPVKLTQYARSMHEGINRWKGVRAKKSTTTI